MATRRAWTSWRAPVASKKPLGRRNLKKAEPPKTWRIVRGDKVGVINGPEVGKVGEVLRVVRERGTVLVDGVRLKERVMPPQEGSKERQVTTYETPVHVSSVQLIDPSDGKPTKIRMGTDVNGNPVRVSRRTGTPIPKPAYEDSDAGKKAAEAKRKYEDKFCDTAAADAARVTYRPSALSFEEEVIAGMRGLEIDWSRLADVDVEDPAPAPRA
eukprot:m.131279 g.131279  ORF g.131279 m.131279 type:complete len:213 (+) comp11309_c0_seq6:1414-2052(+)